MMKCSEFDKYIHDHVDGVLESTISKAMEEHAKTCTHCRQKLNCEIITLNALKSVRKNYTPPYVLREVLDRVQSRPSYISWYKVPAVGTAILVVIALFSVNIFRTPNESPVIVKVDTSIKTEIDRAVELPVTVKLPEPKKRIHKAPRNVVKRNVSTGIVKNQSIRNIDKVTTVQKPLPSKSTHYFVVMTPVLEPDYLAYSENELSSENKLDSSYSIQVEDTDMATVTNLSVTNEVTPDRQPKNTVEFSITNTAPPVEDVTPERSFYYEDNRSINCLDDADGTG